MTKKKQEPTGAKIGRPRTKDLIRKSEGGTAAQDGLPAEYTRFTTIGRVDLIHKLKSYAYTKRLPLRRAFDEIMQKFFEEYESNPDNEKLLDYKPGSYD